MGAAHGAYQLPLDATAAAVCARPWCLSCTLWQARSQEARANWETALDSKDCAIAQLEEALASRQRALVSFRLTAATCSLQPRIVSYALKLYRTSPCNVMFIAEPACRSNMPCSIHLPKHESAVVRV
jgi:hypothetical protein